ncbi:MAG: hypothetical protein WBY53_14975, partial [Acidobacteriaceae bacterium]
MTTPPQPAAAPQQITSPRASSGWQGIALIAITYVYFLIFAQFAFLHRLTALHIADAHLKTVMAAMALGGILFSLLTPRLETPAREASATTNPGPPTSAAVILTLSAAKGKDPRISSPGESPGDHPPTPRRPTRTLQLALAATATAALLTLLPLN